MPRFRTKPRRLLRPLAALLLVLLSGGCATFQRITEEKPFTLIVLPDTQMYARMYPNIFVRQASWIKEWRTLHNIVGVLHEGDITDGSSAAEWRQADTALSTLDGVVPYCLTMGNHDYDPDMAKTLRSATNFNRHFGPPRFAGQPWYGGHYSNGNENAYYLLQGGKHRLLVLCLEFGPRDEVLAWANRVVAAHPGNPTIILTHCYTASDNTLVGPSDSESPRALGFEGNAGTEVWEKLVSRHPNIFLVLSGHVLGDGLGHVISRGIHGNRVDQLLANYQMRKYGGAGWLRILKIHPSQHTIRIKTFSPMLEQFERDAQNQFDIPFPAG
jgi:hypothetical protein